MIRFLLNQEMREVSELSPNTTVLKYLREQAGKSGTKEGCGSGDCGACTVVLGEVKNGELSYQSVNACLTFIGSLQGKQLITVEDLKSGEQLHPVQQAMVEYHGSQCGFCTPGFVMSMFALTKNAPNADRMDVEEALAGNLCRCTGYRPIVDAALSISQEEALHDRFTEYQTEVVEKLLAITDQPSQLTDRSHSAFIPTSSDQLADILLTHPDAKMVAGGTDLALEVTQFHRDIDILVHLGNVSDMKTVNETDTHIEIGANVSLTQVHNILKPYFPDFSKLLHRFASLQVRNQGTLGGNVANASPIGDSPPLLIALNASVVLRKGNKRREISLDDFFKGYKVTELQVSEFIEQIRIPKPSANQIFQAHKVSKRIDDDISAVCAAFNFTIENNVVIDVRLAYGGMAAVPARATLAEQALRGEVFNAINIQKAMTALEADFSPISDCRASKEYRIETAANLLYRFYLQQRLNQSAEQDIQIEVISYVS
ncbi:xanthine dehydrogenase small subunit [Veronia pacifica]|uniref:Xanthine dehydrogenase small subunit n=1 Tax=Veronia pacifica TaxID=1080227 RepID=A0A1C3EG28_9GAMM|nr:xanthine dehydrogenase small subunit [Veronia pacifica]ODA32164.1 xanthine dehydrogenase small subunit [Veronia pacifica]